MTGETILAVTLWALGALVGVTALYLTIRFAVLHALRDHVMSSTTAVSITSSVPLRIADPTPDVAGE
ncbi:hypothetical protein SK224_00180 [Microbacterium sp. BG28]|uniref:hypothetical protein n=1 Tax=Microbacterium sp. BG28 TaxID=3097356 RepID=UPI002A5AD593|nr:hypothetical protein [Microbacterium sp. BG28]MDY0827536.1 hypothetical protein [Microbacterium sp. BG28]